MHDLIKRKYVNVQRKFIDKFVQLCVTCQHKKAIPKAGVVSQPILFKEIGARSQIDLIDMQFCKDDEFKFILNYQNHLSKFIVLKPLSIKTAIEVAYNMLDIFCILECSQTLQSDNGREFFNVIIVELEVSWPSLKILHGKSRHSQSQGSIERANRDVEEMLRVWISDNKTLKWSEGLRFVQLKKIIVYILASDSYRSMKCLEDMQKLALKILLYHLEFKKSFVQKRK